ncbi:hypothetical protein L0F63_004609 [Massospora cicadina]|nr:hypothetical protein L0F63_004609 [Massospora cicadina]
MECVSSPSADSTPEVQDFQNETPLLQDRSNSLPPLIRPLKIKQEDVAEDGIFSDPVYNLSKRHPDATTDILGATHFKKRKEQISTATHNNLSDEPDGSKSTPLVEPAGEQGTLMAPSSYETKFIDDLPNLAHSRRAEDVTNFNGNIESPKDLSAKTDNLFYSSEQKSDGTTKDILSFNESCEGVFDYKAMDHGGLLDNQDDKLVDSSSLESSNSQPNNLMPLQYPKTNFDAVQIELKSSLSYIKLGLILDGFDILAKVTDVVVNNCEMLGLTSRENPYNVDRREFWKGLNNAWLFSLSRIPTAQSEACCLTQNHLKHLRSSVLAWGDSLSPYGLVDYEVGLWETDLIEAIDFALNLYNSSAAPNYAVATPAPKDSRDSAQSEDESHTAFPNSGHSAGLNEYAATEDHSQLATSAIITQLYDLINKPRSDVECHDNHEMDRLPALTEARSPAINGVHKHPLSTVQSPVDRDTEES